MQTNSPEKNRRGTCFHGAYLALAVMLTIGAPSAGASVLVYEGFDHTPGESIHGLNQGSGFQGGWEDFLGLPDLGTIRAGSLPSSSVSSTGNSASLNYGFLRRQVEDIDGAPGTETWSSFLFSLSVSEVASSTIGAFALSPVDGMDSAIWAGVFFNGSEMVFGLGGNIDQPKELSSISPVAGETYLLTVSIEWNDGDTPETIRLYLNPPAGTAPDPGAAIATVTDLNIAAPWETGSPNPNHIAYIATVGILPEGGEVIFDEIRIGDSFADVVSVPEPTTAGLVAIALGALARSRRVRRA